MNSLRWGVVALAAASVGCATAGTREPEAVTPARVAIFYTPLGVCSAFSTTSGYASEDNGPGMIFLVARIDSVVTNEDFAFDPHRVYVNSPGQTEHGGAFDRQFTTVERIQVPPGGLAHPLGDVAVGYRTAAATMIFDAHSFPLKYDEHGVVVRQSHPDSRASTRGECGETAVFTGGE
jgi:hypothetical protein